MISSTNTLAAWPMLFFSLFLCSTLHADPWADVQQILDDTKPIIMGPMPVVTTPSTQTWTPWEANYGRQAMHTGNGDLGVACGSTDSKIEYHLTSNEFQGLIGSIHITRQSGSGSSGSMQATHEMNMKNGEVLITGKVSSTKLETQAYVPYEDGRNHKNYLIIELTNRDGANAPIRIAIEPDNGRLSEGDAERLRGTEGSNLIWGKRQTSWTVDGESPYWRAAYCAKILGATPSAEGSSSTQSWLDITLSPNQTIEIVVALVHESGFTDITNPMPALDEIFQDAKVNLQSVSNTSTLRSGHLNWWKAYWLKAHADFNDKTLHAYYYGALYNMGMSTRPYCAPTALFGLFKHTSGFAFNATQFAPDMHFLNYNFQAGFYGYGSSDRSEQIKAYPEAVFPAYSDWRTITAFDAGFRGMQIFDRWTNQGVGGGYGDADSAMHWADKRLWGWDKYIGRTPGSSRNYAKLNTQKSLGALFSVNLIKSYLYSEDMSLMDYTSEANFATLDQDTRGLSVYQLLLLITEFYEDYIISECKDALEPDGSFALNPDGSRREWQASDGDHYVYRIYDSWAREAENANGSRIAFPSNVRPRLGIGDQDTVYDLGPIRYLLRGMIKISSDRGDTIKHAIWKDMLDHLVDYPTTANSPSDPTYIGRPVYKECYNRPEINYNSQGRHTYIGTMMTWVHPGDECRPGSPEAAMARDTIHELGLWKVHEDYNVVADPSCAVWNGDQSSIIDCTRDATDTLCPSTENDYLEVMDELFDDWNNFANLYPLLVRCFYDGERIIEFLHHERANYGFHEQNLLVDNGPEANSIVEALNDMLIMSHLSPNAGNGGTDIADDRYIKLFPVWPHTRDASFHEIAARGAFLVSAELSNGEVTTCSIESRKGNVCRIENPWPGDGMQVFEGTTQRSTRQVGELYLFNTTAGKTYTLKKGTANTGVMAKLSVSSKQSATPAAITFTLTASTGPISTYELDVDGNGTTDYTGPGPHIHTFTTGGTFASQLTVKDSSGHSDSASQEIDIYSEADLNGVWPLGSGSGTATMETWNNVNSWEASALIPFTNSTPDLVESMSEFRLPYASWSDKPGHRISAVVHIPVTGNYTFYASGSPAADLWIGLNGTPNNMTLLASSSGGTDKVYTSAGASTRIALTAGDQIYLELHHAQNGAWAHASAGWSTDTLPTTVIAGEYLSPYGTTSGTPSNASPTARIHVDRTAGYAPQAIAFDGFGSFDTDGTIASYAWDFGDGSATETQMLTSHTYTQGGTYTATLTVTDNDGDSASSTIDIYVSSNPPPNSPPNAAITVSGSSGIAPFSVTFTSTSTDSDGTIVRHEWDFNNDGTYDDASGTQASHTYTNFGLYTAKLKVTDNDGAYDTETLNIVATSGQIVSNATLTAEDAAHIDIGHPDSTQSNTGLCSVKMGGNTYTRYVLLKFDSSLLIGADVDTAVLTLNVKHDGFATAPSPTALHAFAVADGMPGQNWTGGTSGITWNDVKSSGLISDLGTGLPGSYGQLVPLGSSSTLQVGYDDWVSINSSALADQLDADTDGIITLLLAQELGQNFYVRDPLTVTLAFTVNNPNSAAYDMWAAGEGLTGADADPDADPDHDGIKNLLEYALLPDTLGLPTFTYSGGDIRCHFNSIRPDITYQIRISNDLFNWRNAGPAVTGQPAQSTDVDIHMTTEMQSTKELFMCLKVTN